MAAGDPRLRVRVRIRIRVRVRVRVCMVHVGRTWSCSLLTHCQLTHLVLVLTQLLTY